MIDRHRLLPLLILIAMNAGLSVDPAAAQPGHKTRTSARQFRVVAYVPNWLDLEHYSKTIDWKSITHINIAFENPTDDQGTLSYHAQNKWLLETAHRNNVPVLVSIGGGGVAENDVMRSRYRKLLSADRRGGFARSLADYTQTHGFDGIDVDLEGPMIDADYGPFVGELAKQLRPAGKLLTAALSQGYGGGRVPDETLPMFDFINLMAYDAAGPWNPNEPGQHSSLELATTTAEHWIDRGVKKSAVVLGVPFYGYGFGTDFTRSGISYRSIVEKYPNANEVDQIGNTIWFNGQSTIAAKTRYALDNQLGGIMIWSLQQDTNDETSLLKTITDTINE